MLNQLPRLNPGSTENYISLTTTTTNAAMEFDTTGLDLLLINLVQATGVIGTVVVTLWASLDRVATYSSLTTYNAAGLQTMLRITGITRVRLQTTTADGAAGTLYPIVMGGVDLNA